MAWYDVFRTTRTRTSLVTDEKARMPDVPLLPIPDGYARRSWSDISFDNLDREAYRTNAAVFQCISTLAFGYNEPPPEVIDANDEPQPDHPLMALLNAPNPLMSHAELQIYIAIYKAVGGQCYLHKVRNADGGVIQLWPYHIGLIRPVPSRTAWISEYEYMPDGMITAASDRIRIPASEVIHLKWPSIDLGQPWLALPPLQAVAREVDSDSEMTRYIYAVLMNDAVVRTLITIPKESSPLNETSYNRLVAQFAMRHGGGNRGGVGVVEGGASIARMALNLEELAIEALRRIPEARISGAFRVPAILAGLYTGIEHMTYSNYEEAIRQMTRGTYVPMWKSDAVELTQGLVADFGGGVTVRYNLNKVAALQEAETEKWGRAINGYDKLLLTKNEARAYIGYGNVKDLPTDDPDGDVFKVNAAPAPMQPPIDVTPIPPKQITDQTAAAKALYVMAVREMKAKSTEPLERRMQAVVEDYLKGQYTDWAAAGGDE
jgi:phage portal protein BeeE